MKSILKVYNKLQWNSIFFLCLYRKGATHSIAEGRS